MTGVMSNFMPGWLSMLSMPWRNAMLQGPDVQPAAAINHAAITAATARNDEMADAALAQDAQANAAVIGVAIITAAFSDDEATDAELPVAKRHRSVTCCDSECEGDSQPEPAVQHAAPQPVQLTETSKAQHATQAAQSAHQAEMEDVVSEYMSCSSGSDSDIELIL